MGERSHVDVNGGRLEVETTHGDADLPTIVFLHEGLGSIDLWRGFPDDVVERAGRPSSVVYSRHGYGRSDPAEVPRPVEYMHHEADIILPELLGALGIERPVLIGHSDGASIALLFAGAGNDVAALVCIAPHVFVEPESVAGIEAARAQFDTTDMATRMARYHDDPVATFRGWNDVWASAPFRAWNIQDRLSEVGSPTLLIQGTTDQYGTMAQVEAIAAGISGPSEVVVVDGAGHAPHIDQRDAVVAAIARFLAVAASEDQR